MELWNIIKVSRDYDEAEKYFDEMCQIIEKEKPKMAQLYRQKKENFLAFLKYPQDVRKHTHNQCCGIN